TLRDEAQHAGCPVWDFFAVAGGNAAMEQWQQLEMAGNDRIHLTATGYALQGSLFYQALMDAYAQYHQQLLSPPHAEPAGVTPIEHYTGILTP
ncbi:MAG: hypothetical protein PHV49_07365, partial [Alistipes sp.]|nr:hypothetical protein [Alistipes sp.]